MVTPSYPRYADLPRPDETGLPLAWDVWGPEDQLGALNHVTPETVRAAAAEVRRGVRFNLDLPLHLPFAATQPGAHRRRDAPRQTIHSGDLVGLPVRDDQLDGLWLQGSSQWDGLTHIGDPHHGFYNGVQAHQITGEEGTRNGIEQMAAFGLVTRCVLVDLPRHAQRTGRDWRPLEQSVCDAAFLADCLAAQDTPLRPGDVLLVRSGWLAAFDGAADAAARDHAFRCRTYAGLSGGEDMWEFLWEQRVAAVACDNPTVEVWPPTAGAPCLHWGIARLGLVLGELFDLEALAADSAETGTHTALLTSSPLNLRGGVGSPPNAIAVR